MSLPRREPALSRWPRPSAPLPPRDAFRISSMASSNFSARSASCSRPLGSACGHRRATGLPARLASAFSRLASRPSACSYFRFSRNAATIAAAFWAFPRADTALDQVESQDQRAADRGPPQQRGRSGVCAVRACGRRAEPRVVPALDLFGNAASVPQELALEPLQLGGRDGCGAIECARERVQVDFISLRGDGSPVLVFEPCRARGRLAPRSDR